MFHIMALHHAKVNPQALAFDSLSRDWTFSQLEQDVNAVSVALSRLKDADLSMVGIHCDNLYWHWVFILSLASIGVASASLPDSANPFFLRDVQLLKPPLVLSLGGLSLHDVQVLEITEDWLARVRKETTPSARLDVDYDAVCRYAIASGTDAERRVLAMTFRQAETAIMHLIYQDRVLADLQSGRPHVMSTIGIVSMTGFVIGCSALSGGSPLNFVNHTDIGILLARRIPTVAIVTPGHLAHVVEVLPPGMKRLDTLKLIVTGGRLPQSLRMKTLERLTSSLQVVYGADECGALAMCNVGQTELEDIVGIALPWATIQVVDGQDNPVVPGEEGIVRVCGTGVLDGYIGDGTAQSRKFSNGWFYSGDRGISDENRILRITGRVDDLVSIGGEKFDLAIIDDIARSLLSTNDLGCFISLDETGRYRVNMAFAHEKEFDANALAQGLRAFYPTLPPVVVMRVDHIPLSPEGHVDRERLSSAFVRSGAVF